MPIREECKPNFGRAHLLSSSLLLSYVQIAPSTLTTISSLVSPHLPFLSASIIGGPASATYLPTLYTSSSLANKSHLDSFFALNDKGLKVKIVEGPEESAKALKMGYAGLGKGLTGLAMAMVLCEFAREERNCLVDETRRREGGK